jgi:hypothetical protein
MEIKLFWKNGCARCPQAKELCARLEADGYRVGYYDAESVDGLAEASFHEVMSTPSIVVVDDDDEELFSYRGVVPAYEEIKSCLRA